MPGIEDANVVDVVAQDADGEYMVVMVETRPWGDDPNQLEQLKAKINSYAQFILDGSLISAYPETADKAVRVQLDCVTHPTTEVTAVVDRAAAELAKHGVGFTVNVRG
jgi:hypothetical protein